MPRNRSTNNNNSNSNSNSNSPTPNGNSGGFAQFITSLTEQLPEEARGQFQERFQNLYQEIPPVLQNGLDNGVMFRRDYNRLVNDHRQEASQLSQQQEQLLWQQQELQLREQQLREQFNQFGNTQEYQRQLEAFQQLTARLQEMNLLDVVVDPEADSWAGVLPVNNQPQDQSHLQLPQQQQQQANLPQETPHNNNNHSNNTGAIDMPQNPNTQGHQGQGQGQGQQPPAQLQLQTVMINGQPYVQTPRGFEPVLAAPGQDQGQGQWQGQPQFQGQPGLNNWFQQPQQPYPPQQPPPVQQPNYVTPDQLREVLAQVMVNAPALTEDVNQAVSDLKNLKQINVDARTLSNEWGQSGLPLDTFLDTKYGLSQARQEAEINRRAQELANQQIAAQNNGYNPGLGGGGVPPSRSLVFEAIMSRPAHGQNQPNTNNRIPGQHPAPQVTDTLNSPGQLPYAGGQVVMNTPSTSNQQQQPQSQQPHNNNTNNPGQVAFQPGQSQQQQEYIPPIGQTLGVGIESAAAAIRAGKHSQDRFNVARLDS